MVNKKTNTDNIVITITGPKKFRQEIVNVVHNALMDEKFSPQSKKKGCGFAITSSLPWNDGDTPWDVE